MSEIFLLRGTLGRTLQTSYRWYQVQPCPEESEPGLLFDLTDSVVTWIASGPGFSFSKVLTVEDYDIGAGPVPSVTPLLVTAVQMQSFPTAYDIDVEVTRTSGDVVERLGKHKLRVDP